MGGAFNYKEKTFLESAEAARLAEWLVAEVAFVVVLAERLLAELLAAAFFAVAESFALFTEASFFAALAESAEFLFAKAAFASVATVPVERTAFVAVVASAFAPVFAGARAFGRFIGHDAEVGVVASDGDAREDVQNFLRERLGEFDGTELVKELDAADVAAVDVAFTGDGADDVLWRDVVESADAEIVAQEAFLDTV